MPLTKIQASLAEVLDELTGEGAPELTEHLDKDALKCFACGHRCLIKPGKRGICKVRFNEGGRLRVPMNYVAALACDPTEKKPFFHCLPGSDTLTFGMLGCDLHCAYCQNWLTSQALRDDCGRVDAECDYGGSFSDDGESLRRINGRIELQRAADHG